MKIAIIKYSSGNVFSVQAALQRVGIESIVTNDVSIIQQADKVILPGVGAASAAMASLESSGLNEIICNLRQPVLGICLGMQLLCKYSEEGNVQCLGIFDATVNKFSTNKKVPHIGWNNISGLSSALFNDVEENAYMYYVHSYYACIGDNTIARTKYNDWYSAAFQRDNFYGVQFHPEKSGDVGERILKNFIDL